jgi:hypothetical protein
VFGRGWWTCCLQACAFGTFGDRYVGNSGTEDFTVEHCFGHCAACAIKPVLGMVPTKVTFAVDMSAVAVAKSGVFLSGGMFGTPGSNTRYKMRKSTGSVYTISITIPGNRLYNFKYANGFSDDYSTVETLADGARCAQLDHGDRIVAVYEDDVTADTVCFGECSATCGQPPSGTSKVTFRLKMDAADVSAEGLFVAGGAGGEFGNPGDNQLKFNPSSGFYEKSMALKVGSALTYSYTNGACANWQCKEPLLGKKCAAWWHYNDRALVVPAADLVVPASYFGHCGLERSRKVAVTFFVELSKGVYNTVGGQMAISPHDVHKQGVFLAGGGTFGEPGDHHMTPTDDGWKVFKYTFMLEQGSTHAFSFSLGNDTVSWAGKEQLSGASCAAGEWNDREITVGASDMLVGPFCFGKCCACAHADSPMVSATFAVDMSQTTVSADGVFLAGGSYFTEPKDEYKMSDSDGDGIYTITVEIPSETHQHYAFTNGKCGNSDDWWCKEDLQHAAANKACARSENWHDREMIALTGDLVVPTVCYEGCGPCDPDAFAVGNGDDERRGRRVPDANGGITVTFRLNTDFSQMDDPAKLKIGPSAITPGVWSVAGGGAFGEVGDNKMTLEVGSDTVYEFTTVLTPGAYRYVFVNSHTPGDWDAKEQLKGESSMTACVDQDFGRNQWFDRDLIVPEGPPGMLVAFCFGGCDPSCGMLPDISESKVTFRLDMALVHAVAGQGVFLAGGGVFGNPGDNQMSAVRTCADGESCHTSYELTVMLAPGDYYYTYTNGLGSEWAPWETKEDVQGQHCSGNVWDDRMLTVADDGEDVVVSECFGGCRSCEEMLERRATVTFLVELDPDTDPVDDAGVYLAGGGTFGTPGDNKMVAVAGSDTRFTITYEVPAFTHHYYAFTNGAAADWSGKEALAGAPCAANEWDDRGFEAAESDMTLGPFCFGKCCTCSEGARDITMTLNVILENGVAAGGLFLTGGIFGAPGNLAYQLLDGGADGDLLAGDKMFTLQVAVPSQAHFYFALANGDCADYSCKENLAEKGCGVGAWGDRYMGDTGTKDFTVPIITFGACASDGSTDGGDVTPGVKQGSTNQGAPKQGSTKQAKSTASSGGLNTGVVAGVAVAALFIIVLVVLVAKKMVNDAKLTGGAGNPAKPSFENPLYSDAVDRVHGSTTDFAPALDGFSLGGDDTASIHDGGSKSNPMYEEDADYGRAQTAGYMDVDVPAGDASGGVSAGYMDVDAAGSSGDEEGFGQEE